LSLRADFPCGFAADKENRDPQSTGAPIMNTQKIQVKLAKPVGTCYGVKRALDIVDGALDGSNINPKGKIYSLGPLIHNPRVVEKLRNFGVQVISSLDEIDEGTLIIRTHGTGPKTFELAAKKNLNVLDATCPHVSVAQSAASDLAGAGYFVVVIGEEGHPEVEGILEYAGHNSMVVQNVEALPEEISSRVGVVIQTTQTDSTYEPIIKRLEEVSSEVVVKNTVCFATEQRQHAALELAKDVDVMLVVGGKNSGNTKRLFEICRLVCEKSHCIESTDEIEEAWFEGAKSVGITAGTSTPQYQIDEVAEYLTNASNH
jgi:4-hydroxy-3-methylbut-2-enyl diphosphate reductase